MPFCSLNNEEIKVIPSLLDKKIILNIFFLLVYSYVHTVIYGISSFSAVSVICPV